MAAQRIKPGCAGLGWSSGLAPPHSRFPLPGIKDLGLPLPHTGSDSLTCLELARVRAGQGAQRFQLWQRPRQGNLGCQPPAAPSTAQGMQGGGRQGLPGSPCRPVASWSCPPTCSGLATHALVCPLAHASSQRVFCRCDCCTCVPSCPSLHCRRVLAVLLL